ncbi:MAG: cytochrome c biogenesis CcdA family protein [Promethearchaeota archaeon]
MAAELGLYFLAIGSGIISFLSPCVLGLLPPFMTYIASTAKSRKSSFLLSVLYSVGFFLTFAVLGSIFLVGMMTLDAKKEITIIAGIITITLAIYLFFNRDLQKWWRRMKAARISSDPPGKFEEMPSSSVDSSPLILEETAENPLERLIKPYSQYAGAFALGFSSGSTWIACVTPVYTQILAIAQVQQDYSTAFYLMILYGLGIMIPFILLGTLIGELNMRYLAKFMKFGGKLERIFALFLVWIGIEVLISAFGFPGILSFV